jgi:hypothetical protein
MVPCFLNLLVFTSFFAPFASGLTFVALGSLDRLQPDAMDGLAAVEPYVVAAEGTLTSSASAASAPQALTMGFIDVFLLL